MVRSRILDAAQAEFAAAGYEAASTNSITAGFGGSKATLFRYYATKEQLLEAVLRRIASRWRNTIDLDALPDEDPRSWLEGCGKQTLRWILGPEPLFVGRLAIAEGHRFPALDHIFVELAVEPLQAALSARLAAWTHQRKLRSVSPASDAELFFDLVVSGEVSRALYGGRRRSAQASMRRLRRAVDLFLSGLEGAHGGRRPGRTTVSPAS